MLKSWKKELVSRECRRPVSNALSVCLLEMRPFCLGPPMCCMLANWFRQQGGFIGGQHSTDQRFYTTADMLLKKKALLAGVSGSCCIALMARLALYRQFPNICPSVLEG